MSTSIKIVLDEIRYFLDGKKTYLVGILMILIGLYYSDKELVLQGLSVITLRAGVSKLGV